MRHGALPATMAAPMTSSEDLPAGICSALTFWSGFAVFQAATTCSPQATSCSLLEYQILIGPTAVSASPPPVLPPSRSPRAASVKVMARPTARYPSGRFMVFLPPGLWCSELRGAQDASRGLCGDGVVEPREAVRWAEGRRARAAAAEVTWVTGCAARAATSEWARPGSFRSADGEPFAMIALLGLSGRADRTSVVPPLSRFWQTTSGRHGPPVETRPGTSWVPRIDAPGVDHRPEVRRGVVLEVHRHDGQLLDRETCARRAQQDRQFVRARNSSGRGARTIVWL